MKIILRLIQFWLAWVLPRPRVVLGVALLSAVGCLFYAGMRLEIKTDQLELISPDHPLVELSDRLDPYSIDGTVTFTVVVEAPSQKEARAFLHTLVPRIQKDKRHFRSISYRIDPEQFKKWGLLYLSEQDIGEIADSLREHSDLIHGLAARPDVLELLTIVNREMSTQMVGELFTGFLDTFEPVEGSDSGASMSMPMDTGMDMDTNLDFLTRILEGLNSYLEDEPAYVSPWSAVMKGGAWEMDEEGYFWHGNGQFLVAMVAPQRKRGNITQYQDALDQLRLLIEETCTVFPDVRAGVTGQEALNNDEMITVLGDMSRATWISLLGVLTLMVLILGSIRRPVIEMVSLSVGLCWTFGWTTFFIGHLNILSVVFAPLLCGLGVDYGIHWFSRFREEELKGFPEVRDVIKSVATLAGPGIVIAGVSTGLAFLPFVLTGFRGLMELGLITGVGTFLLMVADFTVIPTLSVFLAGYDSSKMAAKSKRPERNLVRLGPVTARLVLLFVVLGSITAAWTAAGVRFDLNPLRLQAVNAEAVVWEKKLVESSERSVLTAATIASSPQELMEKSRALEALPVVAEVEHLFSFLPENQEEKIPLLRSLGYQVPDLGRVFSPFDSNHVSELVDVLQRIRFKMNEEQAGQWGATRSTMEQMMRVRELIAEAIVLLGDKEPALGRLENYQERFYEDISETWDFLRTASTASPMTADDLPGQVRDMYYHEGKYLIKIYPRESVWEAGALTRFVKSIQSVDPEVIGDTISLHVFSSAFKKACISASLYAVVFIFVLLFLTFRSLSWTLLALVPLVMGTLWTVGIMGWVGMDFNLANSIFMPLVVGAGVEFGVIIIHRMRDGKVKPGALPLSTGRGVVLAALTTTVGFGTLMISEHQGIFSLGFVAATGSLCVLLAALLIMPAILVVASRGRDAVSFRDV